MNQVKYVQRQMAWSDCERNPCLRGISGGYSAFLFCSHLTVSRVKSESWEGGSFAKKDLFKHTGGFFFNLGFVAFAADRLVKLEFVFCKHQDILVYSVF